MSNRTDMATEDISYLIRDITTCMYEIAAESRKANRNALWITAVAAFIGGALGVGAGLLMARFL